MEVVLRRDAFERDPEAFTQAWAKETEALSRRLARARRLLPKVTVPPAHLRKVAQLCLSLGTDGLRGELTVLRAARARAALRGGKAVIEADIAAIAPMALRHRLRRNVLDDTGSEGRIRRALEETLAPVRRARAHASLRCGPGLPSPAPELGGLVLRARPLAAAPALVGLCRGGPGGAASAHIPLGITDDRLYGGLDLSATVRLGRPQLQQGLLAQSHGHALLLPMAERQPEAVLAALQDALDRGVVTVAREGLQGTYPARFVLLAVDEGDAGEAAPERFLERLAFPFFEPAVLAPPPPCPWKRTSGPRPP